MVTSMSIDDAEHCIRYFVFAGLRELDGKKHTAVLSFKVGP